MHSLTHSSKTLASNISLVALRWMSTASKSLNEIPGPKALPFIGVPWSFIRPGVERLPDTVLSYKAQYGKLFKIPAGGMDLIYVCDPKDVETVFRADGLAPQGASTLLEVWTKAMADGKIDLSGHLSFLTGETWKRVRSDLQKKIFPPKEAQNYLVPLHPVANDMSKEFQNNKNDLPTLIALTLLENFGVVLYAERLNLFEQKTSKFVQSVKEAFDCTYKLTFGSQAWKKKETAVYKKFIDSMNYTISYSQILLDKFEKRADFAEEEFKKGNDTYLNEIKDCLAYYLRYSDKVQPHERSSALLGLLLAAVDATASQIQWILHHISRSSSIQENLYLELSNVLQGRNIEPADISKLKYLKAVVKESYRLTPAFGGVPRKIQKDLNIQGFNIPSGTLLMLASDIISHDEAHFEDPNEFKPERWLDGKEREDKDSPILFKVFPLSIGPRMCIGARLADAMMFLVVARLVQDFKIIDLQPEQVIGRRSKLVVAPDPPLKLQFALRQTV